MGQKRQTGQKGSAVAIGDQAGYSPASPPTATAPCRCPVNRQGTGAVAIGYQAGQNPAY